MKAPAGTAPAPVPMEVPQEMAFTTDQLQPGLDRGNSVFDVRHRLTLNYVWELPLFRKRTGFAKSALGGWQLNGIWSFQSGAHWSPFDPRDRAGCGCLCGQCDWLCRRSG